MVFQSSFALLYSGLGRCWCQRGLDYVIWADRIQCWVSLHRFRCIDDPFNVAVNPLWSAGCDFALGSGWVQVEIRTSWSGFLFFVRAIGSDTVSKTNIVVIELKNRRCKSRIKQTIINVIRYCNRLAVSVVTPLISSLCFGLLGFEAHVNLELTVFLESWPCLHYIVCFIIYWDMSHSNFDI